MKRSFLEGLKLEKEVVDQIMAENGKDIEREQEAAKKQYGDYDTVKTQLAKANETLEKFKDYEQTKADVQKYKTEAEKATKDAADKIAQMEKTAKVKDFLSGKKFTSGIVREAVTDKITAALGTDENKGKLIDDKLLGDILGSVTKDQTNIFVDENAPIAPVVKPMAGTPPAVNENGWQQQQQTAAEPKPWNRFKA